MLATQLQAAHRSSLLQRCDPRVNMLAAGIFTLFALLLQHWFPLVMMLLLALLLNVFSGTNWRAIAKRLLAFETFMILLVIMLPFTVTGERWFSIAGFDASTEGAMKGLALLLRSNAVVLALLALMAIREPINLGYGAAALKFPVKLIHLFMMTVRYIQVLGDEFSRLRNAMKARAFSPSSNWHTWRSYGWLMGMLLVRSMERAQRIVDAMRCRGFDGSLYLQTQLVWCRSDTLLLIGITLLSSFPLWIQLLGIFH